jgi:hypothetical protein
MARMTYSQEIADEICIRLAGGESLRAICSSDRDDFMPCQSTVFKWLVENQAFAEQYARAREAQAEGYADEIVRIADGESKESDHNRDRLRVEARKWVAAKLLPKKYGDRVGIDLSADEDTLALLQAGRARAKEASA